MQNSTTDTMNPSTHHHKADHLPSHVRSWLSFKQVAVVLAILALMATALSREAQAHETDQFTVPPQPLGDIGPEVTDEIARRIQGVMDELNQSMDANSPTEKDPRQSRQILLEKIAHSFGRNPFQTELESWIIKNEFKAQPAMFSLSYDESVFSGCAASRPLMVFAVSPTVNINGIYLGLDKMGHFVQQGHQYYARYDNTIRQKDKLRAEALDAAIRVGIGQENGIYGSFTIGVYSNADMAANYAGLYFYINLTQPVSLGGEMYPAILEMKDGRWRFATGQAPKDLLTRFVTHHWNEAMNPPLLSADIRSTYEKNMRKLAPRWVVFYQSSAKIERQRFGTLSRWYGEPYGYAGPDNVVTIDKVYFDAITRADDKPAEASVTDQDVVTTHSPGM